MSNFIFALNGGNHPGIVIELNYAGRTAVEAKCHEAPDEIRKKNCSQLLKRTGAAAVLLYGISFCQDRCKAVLETEIN